MGNLFCSENEEQSKQPAIQSTQYEQQQNPAYPLADYEHPNYQLPPTPEISRTNSQQEQYFPPEKQTTSADDARRNFIVQLAAREMISIKSSRGSAGYFDQGFAQALADHLEETTNFDDCMPHQLPEPANDVSKAAIYHRLSQADDTEGALVDVDSDVESFLYASVPKKERLFSSTGPILENLL